MSDHPTDKIAATGDDSKQPASLSEHYHKARKQLVLWSGILFAWEFIGVDLEGLKAAGGNVGPVVKAIKSPQAVPWVLIIMVAYFFFRTLIEWYQSDPRRRYLRASRIDFGVSLTTAITALTLYFTQRLLEIQIADKIGSSFFAGSFFGFAIAEFILWGRRVHIHIYSDDTSLQRVKKSLQTIRPLWFDVLVLLLLPIIINIFSAYSFRLSSRVFKLPLMQMDYLELSFLVPCYSAIAIRILVRIIIHLFYSRRRAQNVR